MKALLKGIKNFTCEEQGTSAAEYGLLIALISAVIILALQYLGSNLIFPSLESPGPDLVPNE